MSIALPAYLLHKNISLKSDVENLTFKLDFLDSILKLKSKQEALYSMAVGASFIGWTSKMQWIRKTGERSPMDLIILADASGCSPCFTELASGFQFISGASSHLAPRFCVTVVFLSKNTKFPQAYIDQLPLGVNVAVDTCFFFQQIVNEANPGSSIVMLLRASKVCLYCFDVDKRRWASIDQHKKVIQRLANSEMVIRYQRW
jgi:hypothetical protein